MKFAVRPSADYQSWVVCLTDAPGLLDFGCYDFSFHFERYSGASAWRDGLELGYQDARAQEQAGAYFAVHQFFQRFRPEVLNGQG